MNQSDLSTHSRRSLAQGEIPLGRRTIPIGITREQFIRSLAAHISGQPVEWSVKGNRWTKYNLITEILWYPSQPVSFTFCEGALMLVEFTDPEQPDTGWDYPHEIENYLRMKKDVVRELGKENLACESDTESMEAVWEFAGVTLFLACDSKTGGCGIGLRPMMQTKGA